MIGRIQMRRTADVKAIESLREARAAVADFRDTVRVALSEAQSEAQRVLWWVQQDRKGYWKHEIRRRTEKVAEARSELYRAKLAAMDPQASCFEQKKLLQRAEDRLAEAEQKMRNVEKWARVLDREVLLFKGQCQSLGRAVDAELPLADGKLKMMHDQLEAYLRVTPGMPGASKTGAERPADEESSDAEEGAT